MDFMENGGRITGLITDVCIENFVKVEVKARAIAFDNTAPLTSAYEAWPKMGRDNSSYQPTSGSWSIRYL